MNSCWFWHHDWTKLEQFEVKMTYMNWRPGMGKPHVSEGGEWWQKRKCIRCGKEQREKI